MKKRFIKLFSMLACAALAVGLSACDSDNPAQTSSSSSEASSSEDSSWDYSSSSEDSSSSECGHYYNATVTKPTCEDMGYTTYVCVYCGEGYIGDYTKPLSHTAVIDEAVAPTCTETGLTSGAHCDVCGTTIIAQEVVATNGHSLGDWHETKAPTETEEGEKRRDCANCDHFETSPIAMLSHSHDRYEQITLPAVAPTCLDTGLTEGKKCGGCGEILVAQEVVRANGHTTIIDQAVAPTCTQTGLTAGAHCDVCGEILVKQEIVSANGHTEVIDQAIAPTCTQTGLTQGKHCSVCNETIVKQEIVPMEEHPYASNWIYNETHHWHETTCGCDAKGNYGEHTEVDGFCSVCELPMSSTPGIIYDLSADGTYAEVVGYDGTFKRIKIADTYEGKPVKTIYDEAFYNIDNITEVIIPNSVTSIGWGAFYNCNSLTNVTIPDSVTSIGDSAFYWCDSLTSVTIGNSVTSIGVQAFSGCSRLTSVTIPDSVTSIGYDAFSYCSRLTSVTIPDSVTSIGERAFSGCDQLSFATYGNAKYLGNTNNPYLVCIEASNKNYSSYTIHEDTKVIADYAFYECERMTSVTIGNSVTSIGYAAFYGCSSLTSVTIPDSVTSIGDYAFYNCSSLTEITFEGTVEQWKAIEKGVSWKYTVPASVVVCRDGTTCIANHTLMQVAATQPTCIADGYEKHYYCLVCENVFLDSAGATIVDKNTITTPADSAFHNYNSSDVCIHCGNSKGITGTEGVLYRLSSDGTYAVVYGYEGTETKVVIADKYEGKPVTSIGDEAFYNCSSLTSVTIPDSVTSIGKRAFAHCRSLTSVTIPDSVTSIGNSAFESCISLGRVTIPDSVTSIGEQAFMNCSTLSSVRIGNSVTAIGTVAFYGCHVLSSVDIGNSVTSIGDGAFWDCFELMEIQFYGSVEEWKAIRKSADWNSNVPATKVICKDGEVAL